MEMDDQMTFVSLAPDSRDKLFKQAADAHHIKQQSARRDSGKSIPGFPRNIRQESISK